MTNSGLFIIGEIFLVLLGGAAYVLYYFNNLNNQLQNRIENIQKKIKDEKRNAKGLRLTIQQKNEEISQLRQQISDGDSVSNDISSNQFTKPEQEEQAIEKELKALQKTHQQTLNQLEQIKNQQQESSTQLASSQQQIETLQLALQQTEADLKEEQVKSLTNSQTDLSTHSNEIANDFEEMYYDLKNAIAYNMSGGDQVLDVLRDRLKQQGNLSDGEKIDELKSRYNTLGEMVGVLAHDAQIDEREVTPDKAEREKIQAAENLLEEAHRSLQQAEQYRAISDSDYDTSQEDTRRLLQELDSLTQIKEQLKSDLSRTSEQLGAFIKKARLFQAQKEQIKIHKATQNQMHRNFINLSSEYKQATRKLKMLESRNDILASQVKNSTEDPEVLHKLEELRAQLEEKEKVMDRVLMEKEMVEQQFLSISEDSKSEADSTEALARLQSEHQLLEQQFLEVLNDLDKQKKQSD